MRVNRGAGTKLRRRQQAQAVTARCEADKDLMAKQGLLSTQDVMTMSYVLFDADINFFVSLLTCASQKESMLTRLLTNDSRKVERTSEAVRHGLQVFVDAYESRRGAVVVSAQKVREWAGPFDRRVRFLAEPLCRIGSVVASPAQETKEFYYSRY